MLFSGSMVRARTIKRVLLGLLVALALSGTGIAGFVYSQLYRNGIAFDVTVDRTGKAIARHRAEFLNDQAYLASLPIFSKRSGVRDAGPVIGTRIHWVRVRPGALDYPALSDAAIDRGLYDKIGEDWLNADPSLWRGLDFGWMARLSEFDSWDVEQNSISDPEDLMGPDPELSDLLAWAELLLAKGHKEDSLTRAIAEVQELARLCFTTERLTTQLDGIALLSTIRKAEKRDGITPSGTDLRCIHRALFGALAFARLETPQKRRQGSIRSWWAAARRCTTAHGVHF